MAAAPVIRRPLLSPDVSRILFVKSLPFKATTAELYAVFGRYGAIHSIRFGQSSNPETRGKAFVVYEDIYEAKTACEQLNGYNVGGRYIVVLYYQQQKTKTAEATAAEQQSVKQRVAEGREQLNTMKEKFGI